MNDPAPFAPAPPAPDPTRPVLPQRKRLPHEIPPWVSQGARHFITINALNREAAPLTSPSVAAALIQNLVVYEELGRWHLWLALLMPDHIHYIATFNLAFGIQASVSAWKGYQTKKLKIDFQSGFFEHRLRNADEYAEKAAYIRNNPVRKGLVATAEAWPFRWVRGE
jgi:putative transposase